MLGQTGFIGEGLGVACIVVSINVDKKTIRVAIPKSNGHAFREITPDKFFPPSDYGDYLNRYLENLKNNNEIVEVASEPQARDEKDPGKFKSNSSAQNGSFR